MRYIERGVFYYFEQPISKIKDEANLPITSITKQTITKTEKDGVETVVTTSEYNGDPKKKAPYTRKYRVSPLGVNFYYSLLSQEDYEAGQQSKDVGLKAQKEKGAISDTYLSYLDFSRRRVTAIIGLAYFKAETRLVRPYLGLRYNFYPINQNYQSKYYEDMHLEGNCLKKHLSRMSLDLGITLASIQDSARAQYNLFGTSNLVTGLGYKISDGFFISSGFSWYSKKEDIMKPESQLKIKSSLYLSLSFDWDFGRSLDALKKSFGATL
jgi:hypothetical protein